ncbi:N-acetylglucosamine-6-phosphate deacetylase [Paludisphaera borealis]|uniref:N-acetylglucosamine 6-phosphate deacetylase n=1 Tax=Paludisphaera borealis TaxID=1387353 RepID=A0A1U7CNS7_9BACT|nr:amidohydrolase family protein [Paludisphaera borealis]APW60587.1 N-acetylglucosamine 6-phosphate deacetylase [Paludisphaera borealis]
MNLIARDWETSSWIEIAVRDGVVESVDRLDDPAPVGADDPFVAPAFWDVQTNGRWGHSFSSPELTADQVVAIVRAQRELGTARLCPTLVTAPIDHMIHGLRTIASACETHPDVARMVVGIHLEGPYLSDLPGYRGAHPPEAMHDPDWNEFERLQQASGDRVILMTLAPERTGAIAFIDRAARAGLTIALGHTAADGPTLRAAVDAGARLSTHLGNGIVAELPRHPNPIWRQAAEDRLWASLIADGWHLDPDVLRVLVRAKGLDRVVLVSDAGWLSGLPVGTYGDWAVDPSGKIVVAGTPYLAGSNQGLETGLRNLDRVVPCFPRPLLDTVTTNPAALLNRPAPRIAPGEPANLVVVRRPEPGAFTLERTCVDGVWVENSSNP